MDSNGPNPKAEGSDDREQREQQAWEAIVADLSGQMQHLDDEPSVAQRDEVFIQALLDEPNLDESGLDDPHGDDVDGFQPPDPGPLPMPTDAISRFAWAGAIGGPLLVLLSFLLGLGTFVAGLGVAGFVLGFVTLIIRMPDRDREDGDDGAVV